MRGVASATRLCMAFHRSTGVGCLLGGIVALRCVQCACALCLRGKARGIYWNCVCITLDVICTLFTRKEVYF